MVGYGVEFKVKRIIIVVMVGVGYVDGVLRLLGNRCLFMIGGYVVLIVGWILMDLLVFDVIDLFFFDLCEGDYIFFIDYENFIDDIG